MTASRIRLSQQMDVAIDDVLVGVSQLETTDLELFLQKIARLIAQRKSPSVNEQESALLKAINTAISEPLHNRYMFLAQKLHEETITPTEHTELLNLVEQIEDKKVERLRNLIALSQIRNVSLEKLMSDLNLSAHG